MLQEKYWSWDVTEYLNDKADYKTCKLYWHGCKPSGIAAIIELKERLFDEEEHIIEIEYDPSRVKVKLVERNAKHEEKEVSQ